MKYFRYEEFYRSATASSNGINNYPRTQTEVNLVQKNILTLVDKVLDPLRELVGSPILVTSGYRCFELNALIHGSKKSQHLEGKAADISLLDLNDNTKLAYQLLNSNLEWDQLILERIDRNVYRYGWLHVSYNEGKNRGQVLTCYKGYYEYLERIVIRNILEKHLKDTKNPQPLC